MHALNKYRTPLVQMSFFALAVVLMGVLPVDAFAGGLDGVNTFLDQVAAILKGAGVIIVTIALMWCGYKMLFKGASFSDVATIFIGGLLIGGASFIASYLVPAG